MKTRKILTILVLALGLMVWPVSVSQAEPMGTAFAYQGRLIDAGEAADGLYDFQFKLYDANTDGNQLSSDVNAPEADVMDGAFMVELDFGSDVFDGNAVWLEIGVRQGDLDDPNVYTTLSPRQELTPTPYAMHSQNADTLDSFDSGAFASSAHDHDGVYASVAHSHDGVYALISHVHDDRYYTETELQSSGSASVHWDNLTNVPADIADGDDDTDTQLTEAQVDAYVSNNGYLDTETDPIFAASTASGIAPTDITNWNAAFGWSDHSAAGYLTSYTETDPIFAASTASGIAPTDITNWNAAFGWSDHSTAGYLTSYTETDPTVLASVKDGVSWAEIAGIPADIADGDDDTDTQLTEAQVDAYVSNNGYLDIETDPTVLASVKDGVSWAEIASIPADIADGDDDTQLTEAQVDTYVANNGFLDGSSALDWDNITIDMPAGFADGVDNVGGGDSDWTISGSDMYTGAGVTGNVGIGTTTPAAKLTVNGAILRQGSTMYGSNTYTHINLGTSSTTGTNGQNYTYATVGGGNYNTASGYKSTVAGGAGNTASGENATVGGGSNNTAGHLLATVCGGKNNTATAYATVGGGMDNTASWHSATVGGGLENTASLHQATVGGGKQNTASGTSATIGGGDENTASGSRATVGGGRKNDANGIFFATVGGGYGNTASGYSSATVPGGRDNVAGGMYSFAAGYRAKVRDAAATGENLGDEGTFVWADSTEADFTSTGPDQFLIRASGGVGIGTNNPGGFRLAVNGPAAKPGGGSWSVFSDRRLKKNIEPLDGALERMLELKGVSFEYSDSEHFSYVEGEQMGMIAQEVEKVFPEWVDQSAGYKTVTYRGFEAITVEAFRQLRKEKDAEITELKERLAKMEAAVSKLINSNEGGQL